MKIDKQRLDSFTQSYFARLPVSEIKSLNRFDESIEASLEKLAPLVESHIDQIIEVFYGFVINNSRSRAYFANEDQIRFLQATNRRSFVRAFQPPFDESYFAARLRVGYVHYAIDLSPELYVAAIGVLESALGNVFRQHIKDAGELADALDATSRMLKIELQLTLDTYFAMGREDIEKARQESQAILDNLNEGFLMVSKDGQIPLASKSCQRFFGCDLSQSSIGSLPRIPKEKAEFLALGLEQVFENFMPLELNLSLLPARIESEDGRVLQFRYTGVLDAAGEPKQVVVTINDITDSLRQSQELERMNQMNRTLISILRNKEAFSDFLNDTQKDLDALQTCADPVLGKRILHTLKGNSSSFGLNDLAAMVHDFETEVDDHNDKQSYFAQCSRQLQGAIRNFLAAEGAVLGLQEGQSENIVRLNEREMQSLEQFAAQLKDKREARWLESFIRESRLKPAATFMATYEDLIQRLGDRLQKKIRLVVEGEQVKLDPARYAPVFKQLVHAIRNAADHGVESDDDRLAAGKDPCSTIRVVIVNHAGRKEIRVQDDGRGIKREALAAKAVEKGLVTSEWISRANDSDILGLIFADGVSTAKAVSDTSGRGVGMSALKAEVEAIGGRIEVTSVAGKGTTLTIHVDEEASVPAKVRAAV